MKKLLVGYSSPFKKNINKNSPLKMPWVAAAIGAVPGLITAAGSLVGRKKRIAEQEAAKAELEQAKAAYQNMEFKNYYAGLKNPYEENLAEDLTVDQTGADYMKKQTDQQLANIGSTLKTAAGSSGIAGLAQTMANIGTQGAKEASMQIREQERANKRLQLQGEQLKQKGAAQTEMYKIAGERAKDAQEQKRTETMYELALDRNMAADQARMAARQQGVEGLGMAVEGGMSGYYAAQGTGEEEGVNPDNWEKDPDGNWVRKNVTDESPNTNNANTSGKYDGTYAQAIKNDPNLESYISKRDNLTKGSLEYGENQHKINIAYYGKSQADKILADYKKKHNL